jgi:hypothetical protein
MMAGVKGLAQSEKYQQYAEKAQERAEHASTDGDKVAWLLLARSWRGLMPLLNDPAKLSHSRVSAKMPLAGRLHRLRRLRATSPPR